MKNYDEAYNVILGSCFWYDVKDPYWLTDDIFRSLKSKGLIAKDENNTFKNNQTEKEKKQ